MGTGHVLFVLALKWRYTELWKGQLQDCKREPG
jgi:hypothetical protein